MNGERIHRIEPYSGSTRDALLLLREAHVLKVKTIKLAFHPEFKRIETVEMTW